MDFDISQAKTPGFLRRLAALVYDLVLLLGILMLALTIVVVPYDMLFAEPFPHRDPWHRLALQLYLLVCIGGFFGFFWVRGGQTLGMRTWHFRLVRDDGSGLRPRDALLRLVWAMVCLAPAGAGFLWILADRDGLAWYDRLTHTRPVMVKN